MAGYHSNNRSGNRARRVKPLLEALEARRLLAVWADFNNDGFGDLAIGIPSEDIGATLDAGAVQVMQGSASGLTATGDVLWHQGLLGSSDGAEAQDHFGAAIAVGDFNGDGYSDLAVGAPDEDVGTISNTGVVHIIYGSAFGLTTTGNQTWHQDSFRVRDTNETGDRFGAALAAGDFNGDIYVDLAVGVPDEDVGAIVNAGAVSIFRGTIAGLTGSGNLNYHQDWPNVEDVSETSDQFASVLAAGDLNGDGREDLAVGIPSEDLGAVSNAGAVAIFYGSASGLSTTGDQFWHQDSTGILDTVESTDRLGFALAVGDFDNDNYFDLAIGVPYEDIGIANASDAGAVNVIYGTVFGLSSTDNELLYQDMAAVVGDASEVGDFFGHSLTAGDFSGNGWDDLAIGIWGEDVGTVGNAGAVNIQYGTTTGLDTGAGTSQFWSQPQGTVEINDQFGYSVAAGDFNGDGMADLVVGAPGEDVGAVTDAGAINVFVGHEALGGALNATGNQFWHQDVISMEDNCEAFDRFGDVLSGSGW